MKYFFSFLTLFFSLALYSQNARILVEGTFDDWENIAIAYTDVTGDDGPSSIDFGKLRITNDEEFLFFRIEVGKEINLQSDNNVTFYIDTDNDPSTGIPFNGIGAELSYNLREHEGTARLNNTNYSLDHEDIGLVTAPTVTSTEFEIAVRRNGTIAGNPTFTSNVIKVAFEDDSNQGDQIPDQSGGISYTISNENLPPLPEFSISPTGSETFRTVAYNVLQDGLFESNRQPSFERIFKALKPDIIGFTEIYNHSANQVGSLMETFLPSSAGEQWYAAGINPDVICVSRYKIKQSFIIDGVGSSANGAFLIELPAPFNSDLLFIVAHTPCCDNNDGRQLEIDAMMAFIRDAKEGNGFPVLEDKTPIIICGDMNLVGDNQQLHTLLYGDIVNENIYGSFFIPDWDGTAFDDVIPMTTNTPMAYTWATDFSSFSPGRLDFIIYSGSVLEVKNSFNLYTPALSTNDLNANNLEDFDTPIASDHLPVVADFGIPAPVSTIEIESPSSLKIERIYPNPSDNQFFLEYYLPKIEIVKAVLTDSFGREIRTLFDEAQKEGKHIYSFNKRDLNSGIYLLKLMIDNQIDTLKIEVFD